MTEMRTGVPDGGQSDSGAHGTSREALDKRLGEVLDKRQLDKPGELREAARATGILGRRAPWSRPAVRQRFERRLQPAFRSTVSRDSTALTDRPIRTTRLDARSTPVAARASTLW
jgi:hypothetical protein